jgi:hypothetical protein
VRAGNTVAVNGCEQAPHEWQVFDALPPPLRGMLHDALLSFDACRVAERLCDLLDDGMGPRDVLAFMHTELRAAERFQIAAFAEAEWSRGWGEYPHLAAGATIQRYGCRA